MIDLKPVENLTPFTVYVYRGSSHWDKPIEELTQSFPTKVEAKKYIDGICRCGGKFGKSYHFEIVED